MTENLPQPPQPETPTPPARWRLPLALLIAGLMAGWWLGKHPAETPPTATPTATSAPVPAAPRLEVVAPPGGFDPRFVKLAVAGREQVPDSIPLAGKLTFDAEHQHLVSARVSGRLDRIVVFEGAKVSQGQVLAELYSADWIAAQHEYLLARNTVRTFASSGQKDLLEDAKATEQAAKNRLRVLGGAEEDIQRLEKSGVVQNHLGIRAPISGTITQRNLTPGAFLNVGDSLMTLADTSQLWFIGNAYEQDYARVRLGQTLELTAPAFPGRHFSGQVSYLGTSLDPDSHTLPVRCRVENRDGTLRPEMFVDSRLILGRQDAVVIPRNAIVMVKQTAWVMVEISPEHYRRVQVNIASLPDGRVVVKSGLQGGERIVVEGSTLLNQAMSN